MVACRRASVVGEVVRGTPGPATGLVGPSGVLWGIGECGPSDDIIDFSEDMIFRCGKILSFRVEN